MRSNNDILEGSITKALLLFFFPILFGTFFQQLYNTVDAFIVGNFVGKEALAAVGGSTGTLINLLVGFITGVGGGATVVVAQHYGRRDYESVGKCISTSIFLAVLMGGIMMAVGLICGPYLLSLLNVPAEIYDLSLTYMRIYFLGMIPSMIYNMGAGVMRACGDSKRPLYFLIVSTFVNIIFDALFVIVFGLGVAGVAIATVMSQVVSCIMTVYTLNRNSGAGSFSLLHPSVDLAILTTIIVIGLPTGLQSVMYTVSNLFIQRTVNGFGTDTVASFAIFGKVDALFWMFSGSFGTAVLTVVGQNFGAGNIKRTKKTFWIGLMWDIIISALIAGLTYYFGSYMVNLFTDDANVIAISVDILRYLSPLWVTFAAVEVFSSGIRACGDSLTTMIITAICICGVRIAYISLFEFETILEALRCYPLTWSLASVVFTLYYLSGIWLKRCLK